VQDGSGRRQTAEDGGGRRGTTECSSSCSLALTCRASSENDWKGGYNAVRPGPGPGWKDCPIENTASQAQCQLQLENTGITGPITTSMQCDNDIPIHKVRYLYLSEVGTDFITHGEQYSQWARPLRKTAYAQIGRIRLANESLSGLIGAYRPGD